MSRLFVLVAPVVLFTCSNTANAVLIQQTNSDSWNYATRAVVEGGFLLSGNLESSFGRSPTVSIQRFNPLLGSLQSVDMFLQFRAQLSLKADCFGLFYCESGASAGGGHTILLDDLASDLGVSFKDPGNPAPPPSSNVQYGASASAQCEGVLPCSKTSGGADFQQLLFSFVDDDVLGFIDDLDDPSDDVFVFFRQGRREYTGFSASHSGYPTDGNVEQIGDDSNDLGTLLAALDLYVFENQHGIFYSDAHIEYWSSFEVNVTYTYETPPTETPTSVASPDTLPLTAMGLISLLLFRKKQERNRGRNTIYANVQMERGRPVACKTL